MSTSSDEGKAEAHKPDESVEGLMSSDIVVNADDIDFSSYIEGVSTLEDVDEDDDDDAIDRALESNAYAVEKDSRTDHTLRASADGEDEVVSGDFADQTRESTVGNARIVDDGTIDTNVAEDDDDDVDDADEISSIFNVSHEEIVGGETDENPKDDGTDAPSSAGRISGYEAPKGDRRDRNCDGDRDEGNGDDSRHSFRDQTVDDDRGEVVGDDDLGEADDDDQEEAVDDDRHGEADDDDDDDHEEVVGDDFSNSSLSSHSSRPSQSTRNQNLHSRTFIDHDDDNALHQFPTRRSDDSSDAASASAFCDKHHRPSEPDENTPPNLWGISEVVSRLQNNEQQTLQQKQQSQQQFGAGVGSEDGPEDVFDGSEDRRQGGGRRSRAAEEEKENENAENSNPSPTMTNACGRSGRGPKNPQNILQTLSENTSLKRKRDATSIASPSPSARDHRQLLESRCMTAWKDLKTEIKQKFVKWSPDNPHFNDMTASSLANDAFDDAGLLAKDSKEIIQPTAPPLKLPLSKPKEKRRRIDDPLHCFMAHLSDEILLHIFKWLPKLALSRVMRVCRRFHRVGCDESLWHHFDLGDRSVKPGQLGVVLSRGVQTLRLMRAELQGSSLFPVDSFNCGMTVADFGSTLRSAFKVRHLDLSMIVVDGPDLVEELLGLSKKVTHLSLERCSLPPSTLQLVAEMPNLSVLNLSTCSDVGGDGHGLQSESIIPILKGCQLTALNLAWVGLSPASLRQVISHLPPSILHLNLSGNRNTLVDEDVQLLVDKCPFLEVLDISDSHLLSVESVPVLGEGFAQMRHLSISRCYGLQPPSILLPLAAHRALARLDVFGIMSGEALTQFSRHFRREVELNRCYFSYVARPTPWDPPKMKNKGGDLTQIWGLKTNDDLP